MADASHPDLLQQINAVETILAEMELDRMPRLLVLNKWDQLETPARAELADAFPNALPISAKKGEGCKALLEELELLLLRHPASMLATDTPTVLN